MPLLHSPTARRGLLALVTVALLSAAGAVYAQDEAGTSSTTLTIVASDEEMRGVGKSPEQKVAYAESVAQEIDSAMSEVLGLLEGANNDVMRTNCLSDRLAELRRLQASASTARINAQEWLALKNYDLLEEEHKAAFIAQADAKQAAAAARACLGGTKAGRSGQTMLSVNVTGTDESGDDDFGTSPDGSTRPADTTPFNN